MLNARDFSVGEKIHFLWLNWNLEEKPKLRILYKPLGRDGVIREELKSGDEIDFLVTQEKRCVGYPDEEDNLIPCVRNAPLEKGTQCDYCLREDPLLGCSRCKGVDCVNKKAWNYCQRTPHVVYLAGFSEGTIKVGTAKKTRFERRILEQGASIATIVAETDTEIRAKYIETTISKRLIITDAVRTYLKERAIRDSDMTAQMRGINSARKSIRETLDFPEISINNPIREFYTQNFPYRFWRIRFDEEVKVKGEIVYAKGRHVVLEHQNAYWLLDLFQLRGRVLQICGTPTTGQRPLFDTF